MVVTPPRSAREAQGAPQGERAWYEESGPRAEIGWPRSFAARGRDGVGREDKSSKRRAGPNGPVPGSDESPSRGGHGGMPYARDEPDARRGSPAHARSGSQPGLGNHCGGGSTGGKPRGLTPLCAPGWGAPSRAVRGIPPLLVSVPIFRPRHKRGSTYKDATHAIPWKGCLHRRVERGRPPQGPCHRDCLFRGSALTVDTSLARPVRGNGTPPLQGHCPSGRRPDGPGRPRRRCRSSFAGRWGASRCGSG